MKFSTWLLACSFVCLVPHVLSDPGIVLLVGSLLAQRWEES